MSANKLKRRCLHATISTLLLLILFVGVRSMFRPSAIADAKEALRRGDFLLACTHAEIALKQSPGNIEAISVGSEAAETLGDRRRSAAFLYHLPDFFDTTQSLQLWFRKATLLRQLGRTSEARTVLETIVREIPGDPVAIKRLSSLLSTHGFQTDSVRQALALVQRQEADLEHLVLLARNGRAQLPEIQLRRAYEQWPQDPMNIHGLLRLAIANRDVTEIEALLSTMPKSEDSPDLILHKTSHALASDPNGYRDSGLIDHLRELHATASDRALTWIVTSEWARQNSDSLFHQYCLFKVLEIDPWNLSAIHGLAVSVRDEYPELAAAFAAVETRLLRIQRLAEAIEGNRDRDNNIPLIAMQLAEIGRSEEACAWAREMLRWNPDAEWAASIILQPPRCDWQHPAGSMPKTYRTEDYSNRFIRADTATADSSRLQEQVHFVDSTETLGIRFQYDNGVTPNQEGLRMHQWTGGGVGVLDVDHDTWPDLYFSQGGTMPMETHKSRDGDSVFQNQRGQVFVPVEQHAGISETGFGQGVAIGDVNNDGFEDVYVANIGVNRLLLNQGDGSFQAISLHVGGNVWTTSVAIADFNGDGFPDLYDVNYLKGDRVFVQTCDHDGYQRICGPTDFDAERDRILLSGGAGLYSPVSDASLPIGSDSRGMGLLVGRFGVHDGNQIYIANDETANQLIVRETAGQWLDRASASGLAFDYCGKSQGSMGIAGGDSDQSGTFDLFVTNYYGESNTLYQQQAATFFCDATASARLSAPGYAQLGFGCQFLDANCDGDLDLIVANGHLDDFTHQGQPFEMKPQLFINRKAGVFIEAQPTDGFFQTASLGRAIALVDWNRDGSCDFVIGHLDSPTKLVTNLTPPVNPTASLMLIGTKTPRCPVGASAVVETADGRQSAWLTSGDGYQCSNQHVLRFATSRNSGNSATITWPDGHVQPVGKLSSALNAVVQGRTAVYAIPR